MRLLPLLLLAFGCGPTDKPADDTSVQGGDEDGDGYTASEGDCDDGDATVNPGAAEVCDGRDQNCDDEVDEGAGFVYFTDSDGDGFGDADAEFWACSQPEGYVEDSTDCDDADAGVNPDAAELCDDVDQDCDGEIDEDPTDAATWYADTDGDAYGDDAVTEQACDAPAGYVAAGGDCDDASPAYNPGADESDCADPADYNCDGSSGYADADGDGYAACTECNDADPAVNADAIEACNGYDDDCDGTADEDDAADAPRWFADTDGDGFGDADVFTDACAQPAGYVADATDCDDTSAAVAPGAPETCNDLDDDCDGTIDEDDAVGAPIWFADADADGYGAPGSTYAACEVPAGYTADASDCDDTRATDFPGAEETCDTRDNDCDGTVDEDDAVDAATWYVDTDGDGYGEGSATLTACAQPGGYAPYDTDCDDTDAAYNPGADELCTDTVDYNCDGSVSYADADGDGYAACEECDDSDAAVNPAAVELCNTVDDDCDGTIDEDDAADATTWWYDGDADGYGGTTTSAVACAAPADHVATDDDCDDGDAAVRPDATEFCDLLDNDCDGMADEPDAFDAATWYADTDADGYGDAATLEVSCFGPAGFVADATDCDDTRATDYPGAVETCDEHDNDCDGTVDEDSAVDASTWYADADADGYGNLDVDDIACDAPAGYVADWSDCDDTRASDYPGADEYCDGYDNDCDATTDEDAAVDATTWYADADGDTYGDAAMSDVECYAPAGYVADATDCDDTRAGDNPAADESCDGYDNDCDGATDEDSAVDASTWYADADGDTYGDAAMSDIECYAPAGYVADATDCDDTRASDYPGAAEYCDGYDNDCDAATDEDSAVDASTWYADADGDTYGDAAMSDIECYAPAGYVADATDCDDTRASDYPGAAEYCDGYDNDCDAATDEDSAVDASTWYADADGDTYGDAAMSDIECYAPAGYVADATDCDDTRASDYPGAAEYCDGYDNDCDAETDEDASVDVATWYADTDSDGYGDAAVSDVDCYVPGGYVADATDCDDGATDVNPGETEVCENEIDDDCDASTTCRVTDALTVADADVTITGSTATDYVGSAVAGGGDFDGDGTDDIIVGSYGSDLTSSTLNVGRTYVFYGGVASGDISTGDVAFVGAQAGESSGTALAYVPDLDGDGADELLVGAYLYNEGASTDAGRVYLIPGGSTSASLSSAATTTFKGVTTGDFMGFAIDSAGDLDDDGLADIAIGAYLRDTGGASSGSVGIWYGGATGGTENFTNADVIFNGAAASDFVGYDVTGAGDIDGDGFDDLLIGAYGEDTADSGAGAVYVLYGPPAAGTLSPGSADATLLGVAGSDRFGVALAGLGDTNGDGRDDFAVGADQTNAVGTDSGTVYVFTSAPAGTVSASSAEAALDGVTAYDYAGRTLAGPGDLDADGYADLAIGATGYDTPVSGGGAVYFAYGPFASGSLSAMGSMAGAAASDAVGYSLAGGGDSNADGYADVLFGSIAADPGAVSNAGTAWLVYGSGY